MLENELHVDTQGSPSNITRKDREASSVSLQDICPAPANDGQGTVLYSFIRRRSQAEFHSYGLTTVKRLASGEKVEVHVYLWLTNMILCFYIFLVSVS